MRAGSLSERVTFDAPVEAPDGRGGVEVGWSERFTVWAHFRFLRGGEQVIAARLEGRQPVIATVRASPDTRQITTGWRMRDAQRGTVYNVRAVAWTEDMAFYEVLAESGVAV